MANKWTKHLKEYRRKHPGLSLRDAMIEAKRTYNPNKKEDSWF